MSESDASGTMRIAYLDCFSGISGDMFMGALLDAGVSPKLLEGAVAALNLGARLEIAKITKGGLAATKADVWMAGEKDKPRDEYWAEHESIPAHVHEHERGHLHEHADDSRGRGRPRHQGHSHSREHEHSEHHEHVHGRGLKEIREIITGAAISDRAKKTAIAIFENLGAAEAKVHNTDLESIHFHEVGAVDALVDIVCAAVGAEGLGVDEWICSPLNVGGGTVKCAHGILPVPPPAVVELLKGAPTYSSGIQKELVTPTGAAIVKTLASRFGAFPAMTVSTSAYGAGSRDLPGQPNVLRLVVGETSSAETTPQMVSVIEANLDDLNPQVFGYVMDRLFAEGALDVFGTPVQMKKSRPGIVLTVLARPEQASQMTKIIFAETTTLGVRMREERRQLLQRRSTLVQTQWGEVRMKIANLNGTITNYAPEYEDCRRIAEEKGVPLKSVMQEAIRVYLQNG
jgi:pyridinium-3,5-bisthiocarboxylic acid mononucleotide nickel chelatase